jgi:formate hydrogenlyase subunit 3/multisubunit Na+/H+ antiporter MnhD subunit
MLPSLLPDPLHPAVVHLPIALTLLLPPFAIGALWAIRRGARPVRAWGLATAFFAALALSAWVAVETGEQAGERVEQVIAEAPVESHEEAAEAFLALTAIVLGVALVGLLGGRIGQAARLLGTVGTVVLLVAGWRVGHSGGALVYRHGAAAAYTGGTGAVGAGEARAADGARVSGGEDDR